MAALHERVCGVVGCLKICGVFCAYVFMYMMDDGPWMMGLRVSLALGREEGLNLQIPWGGRQCSLDEGCLGNTAPFGYTICLLSCHSLNIRSS